MAFKMAYLNYSLFPVTKCLFYGLIGKPFPIREGVNQKIEKGMGCLRVLLAVVFPPLAVIGKGCGSFIIVFLLTLCGWVPGVIAALIILNNPN